MKIQVNGYTLGHFKRILGKLLTLVDVAIPEGQQNKATKDSIRNLIWNMWDYEASFIEEREFENPTSVEEASLEGESSL